MSEEEARQNKKGLSKNSPVSFCLSWSDMLQELSKPLKDMNELCKAWNFGQICKISVSGLEIISTFFLGGGGSRKAKKGTDIMEGK